MRFFTVNHFASIGFVYSKGTCFGEEARSESQLQHLTAVWPWAKWFVSIGIFPYLHNSTGLIKYYWWDTACVCIYYTYIQVWGILYVYPKIAFLTKGEWGLKTLRKRYFWTKKKKRFKKYLLCRLSKIHFLLNSVHYSSIRIKSLEIIWSPACKTATGHYFALESGISFLVE